MSNRGGRATRIEGYSKNAQTAREAATGGGGGDDDDDDDSRSRSRSERRQSSSGGEEESEDPVDDVESDDETRIRDVAGEEEAQQRQDVAERAAREATLAQTGGVTRLEGAGTTIPRSRSEVGQRADEQSVENASTPVESEDVVVRREDSAERPEGDTTQASERLGEESAEESPTYSADVSEEARRDIARQRAAEQSGLDESELEVERDDGDLVVRRAAAEAEEQPSPDEGRFDAAEDVGPSQGRIQSTDPTHGVDVDVGDERSAFEEDAAVFREAEVAEGVTNPDSDVRNWLQGAAETTGDRISTAVETQASRPGLSQGTLVTSDGVQQVGEEDPQASEFAQGAASTLNLPAAADSAVAGAQAVRYQAEPIVEGDAGEAVDRSGDIAEAGVAVTGDAAQAVAANPERSAGALIGGTATGTAGSAAVRAGARGAARGGRRASAETRALVSDDRGTAQIPRGRQRGSGDSSDSVPTIDDDLQDALANFQRAERSRRAERGARREVERRREERQLREQSPGFEDGSPATRTVSQRESRSVSGPDHDVRTVSGAPDTSRSGPTQAQRQAAQGRSRPDDDLSPRERMLQAQRDSDADADADVQAADVDGQAAASGAGRQAEGLALLSASQQPQVEVDDEIDAQEEDLRVTQTSLTTGAELAQQSALQADADATRLAVEDETGTSTDVGPTQQSDVDVDVRPVEEPDIVEDVGTMPRQRERTQQRPRQAARGRTRVLQRPTEMLQQSERPAQQLTESEAATLDQLARPAPRRSRRRRRPRPDWDIDLPNGTPSSGAAEAGDDGQFTFEFDVPSPDEVLDDQ